VEYRYLPWERGKTQAARGNIDGTFLYSKTDERAKSFVYSDPVIALQNVIFHHKDNPFDWSEPADLAGLTFGGVIGYDYDILRENPDVDVEVDRIGKPELNFKKLAKGRVDAVISNERVGRQLAARAGVADEIAVHPKPTKSEHYYLMISKAVPNHREIIDVFNAGLKALAENGRRDELLASASGES
jgi:polar amino acid transport system substrate-binding protein